MTLHINIMEQLRYQADKFRKQERLQDKELEDIINEIKEGGHSKKTDNNIDGMADKDKHERVMEAVKEGLLQIHGKVPNTKQNGIF
jgi:hypothetical protein